MAASVFDVCVAYQICKPDYREAIRIRSDGDDVSAHAGIQVRHLEAGRLVFRQTEERVGHVAIRSSEKEQMDSDASELVGVGDVNTGVRRGRVRRVRSVSVINKNTASLLITRDHKREWAAGITGQRGS